ncbi:MAG: hypothetical protein HY080_14325 [Gammaproteobacteria bacterium]|nr:hypothetical protein [Gammaproteobacteria bacterium]
MKMPRPDGRVDPGKMTAELWYTPPYLVVIQSIVEYIKSLVANTEAQKKKSSAGEAVVLQTHILSQHNQIAWGAKVSPECKAKVIKICANLGINPTLFCTTTANDSKIDIRFKTYDDGRILNGVNHESDLSLFRFANLGNHSEHSQATWF